MNIKDFPKNRIKLYLAVLVVAFTIFFAALDYLADPDISFLILYLIPILIVVWIAGRRLGIILAVISTAGWFVSDILNKPIRPLPFYSNPLISGWNVFVEMGVFLILIYLVSALKTALLQKKRESELARTDFLTDVANKRYFSEMAALELDRARRYKRPFTIAYIDIDNLKTINDRFGHKAGDNLLCLIAQTMKNNLRKMDTVARLGGDEFAVFMPETKLEQARTVIDRLQKTLSKVAKNNRCPVTFSGGVIYYDNPPRTIGEAIKAADELMYLAKTRGKNKVLYEQRSGQEQ